MPIVDGYEATQKIKEKVSQLNYIDVNIISHSCHNSNDKNYQHMCKKYGYDGLIMKPATEENFNNYITDIINIHVF